ncbi:hypothetical protein Vretimale_6044, partial [Volvox reticuliferus]
MAFSEQLGTIPNFPFRNCATNIGAYWLGPEVQSLGGGKYCFTINVKTQNCNNACCSTDLHKIEFNVSDSCVTQPASEVKATINGVPTKVGAAYGRPVYGRNGTAVLKLTQLGLNLTTAADAQLCLTLKTNRAGKGCNTLEKLCAVTPMAPPGTCTVAMYDSTCKCCPVSQTPQIPVPNVSSPPSPPP